MYHAATKQLGFRARAPGVSVFSARLGSAILSSITRLSISSGIASSSTAHLRNYSDAATLPTYKEDEQNASQENTFDVLLRSAATPSKPKPPPKFGSFVQKQNQSVARDIRGDAFDRVDAPRSISLPRNEEKSSITRLFTPISTYAQRAGDDEPQESFDPAVQRASLLDKEVREKLDGMTPAAIYEELRVMALRTECDVRSIRLWCQYMVQERAQPPNLEMFSALILINVNPSRGSTRDLKKTLKEMEEHKVTLDARTCHDILKVLAIHPDFLLVCDLLEYMQGRWLTLTDEGHRDLLLIYLRSDQTELALEKLDTMLEEGTVIQPWLLDMVVYHLCYLEEYDEILRLLQIRLHDGKDHSISLTMWGIVLDLAAKGSQPDLMMYIWEQRVKPGYLHPPSGVCMNVMLSAVREGNTDLATEVFGVLGDRGITFSHSHYELLLEAYIEARDLFGALDLVCVMQESRIEPDRSSIAALLRYLMENSNLCTEAFTYLQALRTEDGRIIPLAAVNALIETLTKTNRLSEAVEIYKGLKSVVPTGPNLETMNHLLEGCRDALNPTLALSLASEMPILGLTPNASTYNAIISSVLRLTKSTKTDKESPEPRDRVDLQTALAYYDEAQAQGFQLDFMLLYRFVDLLSFTGKYRAMDVFADMEMQFPKSGKKLEELRVRMQSLLMDRLERERKVEEERIARETQDHNEQIIRKVQTE